MIGLTVAQAKEKLREEGRGDVPCLIVNYQSKKPYADADAQRIVRFREADGVFEFTVCNFKTAVIASDEPSTVTEKGT